MQKQDSLHSQEENTNKIVSGKKDKAPSLQMVF